MSTLDTSFTGLQKLYIGGQWRESLGALPPLPAVDPTTEQEICLVPNADAADVEAAVQDARGAARDWRSLSWTVRADRLRRMAARIRSALEPLAELEVVSAGLPISTARADVLRAADEVEYFAGIAGEAKGITIPAGDGVMYTLREPYGVVGRIIPFNHPFNFSAARIAAPLAAGNAVILKAPDQTPLASLALARLVGDLFPPGVLNVLTGTGQVTGAAIAAHPGIPRVALTGSVEAGRAVLRAGAEHIKHVTLELGGKNPTVICEDMDPEKAAVIAIQSMNIRKTMGQSCQSGSRVFVHESIADEFTVQIAKVCAAIVMEDPRSERSEMGPLAFRGHYERVLGHIGNAIEDGAELVHGGGRPDHLDRGYFVAPTVFDHVTEGMRLFREEVFGPVVAVTRWADEEDLVAQINSIELGLTARIWTNDAKRVRRLVNDIEAGVVWVNDTGTKPRGMPIGGYKLSGLGKESSVEELLSYTREKAVYEAM